MEKRLFKVGDAYHICDDCGAWVPASRYRCDECGGDISPMSRLYKVSEGMGASPEDVPGASGMCPECVPEASGMCPEDVRGADGMCPEDVPDTAAGMPKDSLKAAAGAAELLSGQPVLRCTACGKRFAFGRSSCPDCGGIPVPEMPQENRTETDTESAGTGGEACYCYMAFLYDDYGRRTQAKKAVKLKPGENILGRNSFLRNPDLFFTANLLTARVREKYSGISRENVILTLKDSRLSVRYVSERKSPVQINGIELQEGDSAVLEEGDVLHFGDDDAEGCIEVEIQRYEPAPELMVQEALEAIRRDTSESRKQLGRIEEGTAAIGRDMTEVLRGQEALRAAMEKITAEDLRVRESDREDESVWEIVEAPEGWQLRKRTGKEGSYTGRLGALMPDSESVEVIRNTIRDFLTMKKTGAAPEEYYGQVEKSLESKQFQLYLYQAAFFEGTCDNILRTAGVEDYAAPLSFLGKAVEEFICTEYVQVIFKTQWEDFKAYAESRGKRLGGYVPQGLLVWYMGCGEKDSEEVAEEKRKRLLKVLEAAGGCEDDKERLETLKNAARQLGLITKTRNNAVHASASDKISNFKGNRKYLQTNKKMPSKIIKKEEYERMKWEIFSCGALKLVHEYYEEICVKPALEEKAERNRRKQEKNNQQKNNQQKNNQQKNNQQKNKQMKKDSCLQAEPLKDRRG